MDNQIISLWFAVEEVEWVTSHQFWIYLFIFKCSFSSIEKQHTHKFLALRILVVFKILIFVWTLRHELHSVLYFGEIAGVALFEPQFKWLISWLWPSPFPPTPAVTLDLALSLWNCWALLSIQYRHTRIYLLFNEILLLTFCRWICSCDINGVNNCLKIHIWYLYQDPSYKLICQKLNNLNNIGNQARWWLPFASATSTFWLVITFFPCMQRHVGMMC